jgi:hypothetical protein
MLLLRHWLAFRRHLLTAHYDDEHKNDKNDSENNSDRSRTHNWICRQYEHINTLLLVSLVSLPLVIVVRLIDGDSGYLGTSNAEIHK